MPSSLFDLLLGPSRGPETRTAQPTQPTEYQPGIKLGDTRYRSHLEMYRTWQLDNPELAPGMTFGQWQQQYAPGMTAGQ